MTKLRRHDWRSHRSIECNICGEQLQSREHISIHRKIAHRMVQKLKCKFYPNCLDENECFFIHEDISNEENEKNEFCLEGENCRDQSCDFSERDHRRARDILCKFQSKCNKPACRYRHIVEKASFLGNCTQNFVRK